MKEIHIYTDGACSFNPGPGGWAAVLQYGGVRKDISGGEGITTNNRMELTAVIKGIEVLKEPCKVTIYSDSAYVINAFNQSWLVKWQKNGWLNSKNLPVENKDLWVALLDLTSQHHVSFVKVKGHADNEINNLCDSLAKAEVAKILSTKGVVD